MRYIFIFLTVLLLFFATGFFITPWTGYIDVNGNRVIPTDYFIENKGGFSEGLAAVKKNGEWFYINTSGDRMLSGSTRIFRRPCGGKNEWVVWMTLVKDMLLQEKKMGLKDI